MTVASINRVVSLFWPLNNEADVAGYHVYRAEEEGTPLSNWRRLNAQLLQHVLHPDSSSGTFS